MKSKSAEIWKMAACLTFLMGCSILRSSEPSGAASFVTVAGLRTRLRTPCGQA
ncbi:MAG: hypothetical protein ACRYHQ_24145 [Janthinobacterium lividum]